MEDKVSSNHGLRLVRNNNTHDDFEVYAGSEKIDDDLFIIQECKRKKNNVPSGTSVFPGCPANKKLESKEEDSDQLDEKSKQLCDGLKFKKKKERDYGEMAEKLEKKNEDYEFETAVNNNKKKYVQTLKKKDNNDGPLPCRSKKIEENQFEKIDVPYCRNIENEILWPLKEEDEDNEDISDIYLLKKHDIAEEEERASWNNFLLSFKKNQKKHPKTGNSRSNPAPKNKSSANCNIRDGSLNKFSVEISREKSEKNISTSSSRKIENTILFEKEDKDVNQDRSLQDDVPQVPNFDVNENADPLSSFASTVSNRNKASIFDQRDR